MDDKIGLSGSKIDRGASEHLIIKIVFEIGVQYVMGAEIVAVVNTLPKAQARNTCGRA